jgi:hypothetical protein
MSGVTRSPRPRGGFGVLPWFSATVPVLVAPRGHAERGGELGTIGVGFDGSPESRSALAFAHEIATPSARACEYAEATEAASSAARAS